MRPDFLASLMLVFWAPCLALALLQQTSSSSSSSSSSTTTTTTTSFVRFKANKLRRPEACRENLPRKSEDLPALVIVGRVKEVFSGEPAAAPISGGDPQVETAPGSGRALVNIGRVIKGNQQLDGSDIVVTGFNGSGGGGGGPPTTAGQTSCPNYVKPNDTWILLLNHLGDRKYGVQSNNLLSMNLYNLERINAIAADEPYKRRPHIEDIQCEAHYCAYGRCVVSERTGQLSCHCPENCPPAVSDNPICGSDNATYATECQLIKEGCRLKKPLFVTKESSC